MFSLDDVKTIFQLSRVGCSSLGWTLNKETGDLKLYCSTLVKYKCVNTGCHPELCPKVQERIPIKIQDPEYKAFFDGGARPNPGTITIGGYIQDDKGKIITRYSKHLGHGTNNQAEYLSLLYLVTLLVENSIKNVKIYGDSQLAVKQINGEWKVKDLILKDYWDKIHDCLKLIPKWELSHVPREENQEADSLT